MPRRRNVVATSPAAHQPAPPQACSAGGFCGWALRRIVLVYILFTALFTCPTTPGHFICRSQALVRTTLVAPVHRYLLTTETGARVNSAYNAHLVPFYEKHAQPIVDTAYGFVSETAAPAIYAATEPVRNSVSRAVEPHREKVAAAYAKHVGPVVDSTVGVVWRAVDQWVVPFVSGVQTVVVRGAERVVPVVNDYVVPFYRDTVYPRWNHQIKPAACRYTKIVVHYSRTEVLPAIADGATRFYAVSRDFAMTHVVPHAKRGAIHTYVFLKTHVEPPICRLYEQNLKTHVDRVVPWDHVSKVTRAMSNVGGGAWAFAKGFAEEFYFMCYTIVTGDEHPLVVARIKADEDAKKKAATTAAFVASVESKEEVGQLQGLARKLSGSARQWIQAARGWVGSVASTGVVRSYESRMQATVSQQWSQATSFAAAVTSVVADELLFPATTTTAAIVAEDEEEEEEVVVGVFEQPENNNVASSVNFDTVYFPELAVETPEQIILAVETPAADIDVETTAAPVVSVVSVPSVDIPASIIDIVKAPLVAEILEPVASVVEIPPIDTPAPIVSVIEAPQVVISEPAVEISQVHIPEPVVEAPLVNIPEAAVESPLVDIPEPVVDTLSIEIPAPVANVIELPPAESYDLSETSIAATLTEQPEEATPSVVEQQTTLPAEPIDSVIPVPADEAASLVYEARDKMAGVLVNDDERAVFSELVKSATSGVDKLEEFPSILNDIDSTPIVDEKEEAAPFVPQTTVPSTTAAVEATTTPPVGGLVDEDVRKAASNWVKDARESISKELAQERTRAESLPAGDEADVSQPIEETSAMAGVPQPPVIAETTAAASSEQQQLASEPSVSDITAASPAQPANEPPLSRRVPPAKVVSEPSIPAAVPSAEEVKQPPSVSERIESVKRLKKPIIADAPTGDATTAKGPRKVKKTKKRVVKKDN
ncbi:hypothetical protein GGI21_001777 [Coemansia aciculifera]|nr:hypothetical protein GGI21_001777 [Coemansia aciculifera]